MDSEKIIQILSHALRGVDLSDSDKAVEVIVDRLWTKELEELEQALEILSALHSRIDAKLAEYAWNR